ncbi:hypothetical protein CspHIS471_0611080 [Cutaneotrichosporon sp. HIS471]|nr:hypothetical protein CspHIS471_0611080 [Cutaneotrichosporon sp. HIS471]
MSENSSDKRVINLRARLCNTIALWHIVVVSGVAIVIDAIAVRGTFGGSITAQASLGLYLLSCFAAWIKIILIAGTVSFQAIYTLEKKYRFGEPFTGHEIYSLEKKDTAETFADRKLSPLVSPSRTVRLHALVLIVCWMTLFVFEVETLLLIGYASLFHHGVAGLITVLIFQTTATGALICSVLTRTRKSMSETGFHLGFLILVGLASGPAYRWAKENPRVGFGLLPAALAWADCGLLLLNMVYDIYVHLRFGDAGIQVDFSDVLGV